MNYIAKQLHKIHAYVKRHAQVTQNHYSIAEALNSDRTPNTFKISNHLPKPLYGVFRTTSSKPTTTRFNNSRRLGRGVADELKVKIDRLVEAAEAVCS